MKKLILYIIATTGVLFTSCDRNKSLAEDALAKIPSTAEIGTVEYVITKLIKTSDTAFYKFGDRKIIFSCKATMKAGIDMREFSKEDVKFSGKDITITLPQPKVLALNMSPEDIKLEYSKISGMRMEFDTADRMNLLQQGEKAILDDAENLGIITDAKKNAEDFFKILLSHCEFENINICFKEPKEKK